jgi:hypothetical protein
MWRCRSSGGGAGIAGRPRRGSSSSRSACCRSFPTVSSLWCSAPLCSRTPEAARALAAWCRRSWAACGQSRLPRSSQACTSRAGGLLERQQPPPGTRSHAPWHCCCSYAPRRSRGAFPFGMPQRQAGLPPVTIDNLRTIAPHYGELLALLVSLTWLLHVGPGFETCLVPLSFG